ncbi:hypothetical protein K1Y78_26795 [Streptomyces sp. tea 10]|nr:hypothetical protein [Streptomyces sp. tea 10]
MDKDKEPQPWVRGITMRPLDNRGLYLTRQREQGNESALETPVERKRRIVAYGLRSAGGQIDRTMESVRGMVTALDFEVVCELSDVHAPHAPLDRHGWNEARRLIQSGFADGIAVLNREAISVVDDEYEAELRWLGERPALLLLAIHEAAP